MMTTSVRARGDDVAREARADLIAALAVDAAVQHLPVGMRLHQPVGELALDVAGAVGRRLDGDWKPGVPAVVESPSATIVAMAVPVNVFAGSGYCRQIGDLTGRISHDTLSNHPEIRVSF